jgi:hypothetical protein
MFDRRPSQKPLLGLFLVAAISVLICQELELLILAEKKLQGFGVTAKGLATCER